jgi:hypothetical protein
VDAAMVSFSPTEAAFEGFRITRERPRVVLVWAAASLAFSFLMGVIAFFTLGPEFDSILNTFRSPTVSPQDFWRAIDAMWPFLAIAAPAAILFQAVLNCAIYRVILRPQDGGLAYIRLGGDELRVAGVTLVYAIVWALVLFLTMVTALVGGVFSGPVAAFLGSVLSGAACFYSVIILVRLSLAAPISFSEKRFTLLASWKATRGNFWRLFGTYAMAFALGAVALILMWVLFGVIELVTLSLGGASITSLSGPVASPAIVVTALFSQAAFALMATCYRLIMESPPAVIYKHLVMDGV